MIKLVFCVHKRTDISQAEFHRYWLEDHGSRVRGHALALGITRYVQSHRLDSEINGRFEQSRGMASAHDGIAELWWADMATFTEATGSEAGIAAGLDLLEDERKFIDLERSTMFLTEEHEIV